jgi:hypothetical protein
MPNRKDRNRDVIRMALLVRERLAEFQASKPLIIPETEWRECQRLARLAEKAVNKDWRGAAWRIRPRLTQALREFQEALSRTLTEHLCQQSPPCPSLRELHAELLGLIDEFPNTDCNLRGKTLSVMTDSVTLEDVYLGPFRIELDVGITGVGLGYSVVATDPNPAANSDEITHPHVQSNQLCEGEGTLPIRSALQEGRLSDLFQIIAQVLQTYNPDSAYVALNEWEGISCVACGTSVCEDERTRCSTSDDLVCYECAVTCSDCDRDFAPESTNRCNKCKEQFCDRCLEGGLCDDCQKEAEQEEDEAAQRQTEAGPCGCSGDSRHMESPEPSGTAIG